MFVLKKENPAVRKKQRDFFIIKFIIALPQNG